VLFNYYSSLVLCFSLCKRRKARVCWPSSLTIRNGCLCSLIFFLLSPASLLLTCTPTQSYIFSLQATAHNPLSHSLSVCISSHNQRLAFLASLPRRDSTTSTIDCLIHTLQRLINLGTAAFQHDQLPTFRYLQTPETTYNNFQRAGTTFSLRPSPSIYRVEIR
jgi:hypothetical protein